jgi:hypothetical protein
VPLEAFQQFASKTVLSTVQALSASNLRHAKFIDDSYEKHQQKALLVCQTCFPDAQIVWMLALIASLKQGFSITAILAGYYNPATIPNPRNPPNPKISPLDDLAVRAPPL